MTATQKTLDAILTFEPRGIGVLAVLLNIRTTRMLTKCESETLARLAANIRAATATVRPDHLSALAQSFPVPGRDPHEEEEGGVDEDPREDETPDEISHLPPP